MVFYINKLINKIKWFDIKKYTYIVIHIQSYSNTELAMDIPNPKTFLFDQIFRHIYFENFGYIIIENSFCANTKMKKMMHNV